MNKFDGRYLDLCKDILSNGDSLEFIDMCLIFLNLMVPIIHIVLWNVQIGTIRLRKIKYMSINSKESKIDKMKRSERRLALRNSAREQIASRESITIKINLSREEILKLYELSDLKQVDLRRVIEVMVREALNSEK